MSLQNARYQTATRRTYGRSGIRELVSLEWFLQTAAIDDGIATGLTMHAAVNVLQQHQPQKIIIATSVASSSAIAQLKTQVDDIICLLEPKSFNAVGFWYEDFSQITDREVCDLLSLETHSTLAGSC